MKNVCFNTISEQWDQILSNNTPSYSRTLRAMGMVPIGTIALLVGAIFECLGRAVCLDRLIARCFRPIKKNDDALPAILTTTTVTQSVLAQSPPSASCVLLSKSMAIVLSPDSQVSFQAVAKQTGSAATVQSVSKEVSSLPDLVAGTVVRGVTGYYPENRYRLISRVGACKPVAYEEVEMRDEAEKDAIPKSLAEICKAHPSRKYVLIGTNGRNLANYVVYDEEALWQMIQLNHDKISAEGNTEKDRGIAKGLFDGMIAHFHKNEKAECVECCARLMRVINSINPDAFIHTAYGFPGEVRRLNADLVLTPAMRDFEILRKEYPQFNGTNIVSRVLSYYYQDPHSIPPPIVRARKTLDTFEFDVRSDYFIRENGLFRCGFLPFKAT